MQTPTAENGTGIPEIEAVVAELNQEYSGVLPEAALREAQRRREEITPRLIRLLRDAAATVRAGEELTGNGHLFALFLLTEFRAKDALPAIIEAVSLPDDGAFELFGDAVTEDLSGVLAALADDSLATIDEMIANRSLNEYVRWSAAQTYLHFVRDGRLTRDEAVQRLRQRLSEAITNRDRAIAGPLISELVNYSPREAFDEIKAAFANRLVERSLVTMKDVERSISEGEACVQRALKICPPTGVEDTVEELSQWASYQQYDEDDEIDADDYEDDGYDSTLHSPLSGASTLAGRRWDDDLDPRALEPPATIRHTAPRVGRNDPCPCGSGKKFKRCCGAGP